MVKTKAKGIVSEKVRSPAGLRAGDLGSTVFTGDRPKRGSLYITSPSALPASSPGPIGRLPAIRVGGRAPERNEVEIAHT